MSQAVIRSRIYRTLRGMISSRVSRHSIQDFKPTLRNAALSAAHAAAISLLIPKDLLLKHNTVHTRLQQSKHRRRLPF